MAEIEAGNEQILLVDDNPINLQILYKTLQGCGYRLLIAKNGETALEIVQRAKPLLVLLDVMMPGMDGFEVCQRIKASPETANVAVIFLSALGDSQAKVRGFAVGGVDYIAKPFQSDEVVARVRTHIKIHRLERELARRNNELEVENQQILNAIDEGIIGLDRDGRITYINPAASQITGWPAADIIGELLEGLPIFQNAGSGGERSLFGRAYMLRHKLHNEMEMVRRRDGSFLAVALTFSPRDGDGAVLVMRDISEWLEHEEALRVAREEMESQRQHMAHMERLSSSGEMAAGIAHEVNQPLTAVVNYAQVGKRLLERDELDRAKLVDLLDKVNTQAVRASEVIKRLRSYVKKPDIGRTEIDINQLLQEVVSLAEVDSRINDVSIHLEFENTLPLVAVDVIQIQQVALNLLRNAMEAMHDAKDQHLGVVVQTGMDDGKVSFRVIDRGCGVSDAVLAQLFRPFYTTKATGMGIGLSICQSIVQAHGGEIGCYNNTEGGATFYCRLPPAEQK
ncbi:MAG: hybrid sensor histidine kinase/response regulator [Verrucomicrobiaceae bacterium]|nr:hybrid sensor histidine kinase/response regulator [Verrucomicrobiaceae bacterium]